MNFYKINTDSIIAESFEDALKKWFKFKFTTSYEIIGEEDWNCSGNNCKEYEIRIFSLLNDRYEKVFVRLTEIKPTINGNY